MGACFLHHSLARSHSACLSLESLSAQRSFFCPPKVQIHVELLFLFFILAAQIQTSVRPSDAMDAEDADDGQGAHRVNDGGDDASRARVSSPSFRQMCPRHSVEISNAKTRIPPTTRSSFWSRPRSDEDYLPEAEDGARYRDRDKPFRRVNESCR